MVKKAKPENDDYLPRNEKVKKIKFPESTHESLIV